MHFSVQKDYLYPQDTLMTQEILLITSEFWELKSSRQYK